MRERHNASSSLSLSFFRSGGVFCVGGLQGNMSERSDGEWRDRDRENLRIRLLNS